MQSHTVTTQQGHGFRRRLGPVQSPVVSATMTRKFNEARATSSVRRATISIMVASLLLLDWYAKLALYKLQDPILILINPHHVLRYCGLLYLLLDGLTVDVLHYAEVIVMIVLFLSSLYDFTIFVSTFFMKTQIQLTTDQCRMLGIKQSGTVHQ